MSVDNATSKLLERPQLLISIANVAFSPRLSCLLHMDVVTHRRQWVDVGLGRPLVSGVGISADDRYVYHVFVEVLDFRTYIAVLSRRAHWRCSAHWTTPRD